MQDIEAITRRVILIGKGQKLLDSTLEEYYCFFKLRFAIGLQYRMASVTALTTQLIWGLMECLAYRAIAEASGGNLPMDYSSIVTYIWLKEAVFSEKIPVFSRDVSLCLYAECSISDIQRRSCRRGNILVYPETIFLAGDTDAFGTCPMETGGKKNHNTGRLTP